MHEAVAPAAAMRAMRALTFVLAESSAARRATRDAT